MKNAGLKGAVGALAFALSMFGGAALAGGQAGKIQKDDSAKTAEQLEWSEEEGVGGSGAEGEEELVDEDEKDSDRRWDASEIGPVLDNNPGDEAKYGGEGTGGSGEDDRRWDATEIGPILDNNPGDEDAFGEEGVGGAAEEGKDSSSSVVEKAEEVFGLDSEPLFKLSAGVGLSGFTGDIAEVTGIGPSWSVMANAQGSSLLGVELGYEGLRNPVQDPRAANNAAIWKHGLGGLLKVGPTLDNDLRPFVGGGLGLAYVNANDAAEGLMRNDFHYEVPLAAGVEINRGALVAGARATYKFLVSEEFAEPAFGGASAEGRQIGAQINLGGRF